MRLLGSQLDARHLHNNLQSVLLEHLAESSLRRIVDFCKLSRLRENGFSALNPLAGIEYWADTDVIIAPSISERLIGFTANIAGLVWFVVLIRYTKRRCFRPYMFIFVTTR